MIPLLTTPAFSQDGWSRLQVGDEEVLIFRDEYGVPHILAENAQALFEAFGYVVAQDRLVQLEMARREARGRLAEILGPDLLPSDIATRRETYTEEELLYQYDSLGSETKALLEAYVRGVNRWIKELDEDKENNPFGASWELYPTGVRPEPWSITDSLAVMVSSGRRFGEFGGRELENLEELDKLGKGEFEKRYPLNDMGAPTTISFMGGNRKGYVAQVTSTTKIGGRRRRPCELLQGPPRAGFADLFGEPEADSPSGRNFSPAYKRDRADKEEGADLKARPNNGGSAYGTICATKGIYGLPKKLGSYAVLVSPKRSASSKALLLGCPQMGLEGPQPGYEVDLHGGGFDVAGMTFPGVPAVLIGYNQYVAWTLTSGCSDNVDVFVEELNPRDPLEYRYLGQWLRLETREEVFRVKDSGPVKERFYRSLHGPIFRIEGGKAYSHKRTFWLEELKALEVFLQMNRARYIEDFYRAVGLIPLSFNLFYAGAEGQIGYWHLGRYRLLAPGADPRLPLSGTGLEEWRGFVPMDWLPHRINPPEGYIANWNNKPAKNWDNGDNLPWVGDHRVRRILSVLEGKEKIGLEDLQGLPKEIDSHGTYEQMVELGTPRFKVVNILPPGESGSMGKEEVVHPHSQDQKGLFEQWQHKPAYFSCGDGDSDDDGVMDWEEARKGTNPFGKD